MKENQLILPNTTKLRYLHNQNNGKLSYQSIQKKSKLYKN